jgi:predicted metal-dependent phosphoesterase TrpH
MEVDLHMHSLHSNDSRSKVNEMVDRAASTGLGAIAVTDHNSWEGAREASRLANGRIIIIPGAEIKTDRGDVLALFVDNEIAARAFSEVLEAIRTAGGISVIPHPGDSPKITRDDILKADGFEAFNSTCTRRSNEYASRLAAELGRPTFASSDAHLVAEIGNGRTKVPDCKTLAELRERILENPAPSRMEQSNIFVHRINEAFNFGTKGIWRR